MPQARRSSDSEFGCLLACLSGVSNVNGCASIRAFSQLSQRAGRLGFWLLVFAAGFSRSVGRLDHGA